MWVFTFPYILFSGFFSVPKVCYYKNNDDQKNKSKIPSASCGGGLVWKLEARNPGRQWELWQEGTGCREGEMDPSHLG